jgi:signal transduction histidine kinase
MKALKSYSLRLALTYASLFLASLASLGGLYYWFNIHQPLVSVRSEILAESARLASLYADVGPTGLAPILEARASTASRTIAFHALLSPDGRTLTANLPSWPSARTRDWISIDADVSREGREDEYEALVFDRPLPDGGRLLIGRDIEQIDGLSEVLAETAIWLVPALLFLVMAGGFVMSLNFAHRIEAVDAAARRVMSGDFSERVPVRGNGDDFDRLSTTLNLMLTRIEASLEAVRRVSDSVAHELRTPLARLQAELADLEPDMADDVRDRFDRIVKETQRLARIFDAVLRISRIEAGSHSARSERVDLSALLTDATELYQPAAEGKALDLVMDVPPALVVEGDADLLFQAVGNLLDNAVKFTPPSGSITLSAGEQSGTVWFAIADTGAGIAVELRDKVSERFFRAPSTDGTQGFGLGLSLVAAIAVAHHSAIDLQSADPGLQVRWQFPRVA